MNIVLRIKVKGLRNCFLLCALLFQGIAFSQVTFTDSNLPIVLITTDTDPQTGQPMNIPDDPKIPASMKIIFRPDGSRNFLTDQNNAEYLNYNGRIKIELRGSSSQDLPKKQYGWTTYEDNTTTKKNVSILGMPSENDWILNGLAFDPSLMRDYLSYNLTRQMGNYTTRTQYCEVMINGEYRGLYVLQEKLKDDSKRINIEEITEDDNAGVNLTGGYITKADKLTGGDPVAWEMESYVGWVNFVHELPKPADVTTTQHNYIHSQFIALAITSHNNNISPFSGYPSLIDVPTFVDYMIINELASNADAYAVSTFLHKDRGGKLRAGPVWDMNLTFGNDLFEYGYDRSHTNVWQFSDGGNEGPKFWTDLFNNNTYKCYMAKRWNELTQPGQPLHYTNITTFIDATVAFIDEARLREQQRWGTVPNHALEIANLKTWLQARINWMTLNLGSFNNCSAVAVPSLVINKINYNPGTNETFTEANDQEFIEIVNTGTATASLTGIYLKELGISYQFPANAVLDAGQSVYIASNSTVFEARYGFASFGQFVRNLSNSSHKLVLADSFGNVIDVVEYKDAAPWPDADGNGSYLQLIETGMDNSLASSWRASDAETLSSTSFTQVSAFTFYPNPVKDVLFITSKSTIKNIEVYDIYGKLLQTVTKNADEATIDFSNYSSGIYFIKAAGKEGVKTHKLIKE